MQRRVFLLVGLLLVLPALAKASVISAQGGPIINLLPETAGQVVTLLISGSDFYSDSNLRTIVNGGVGPAPAVALIFNDPAGTIPGANLVGSVWQAGAGGIQGNPNGTISDSSGLLAGAGLATSAFTPQNTAGIYATLTFTTVGVPAGDYIVDLGGTDLFNGIDDETFEPFPVPLNAVPFTISIVPEPSSIVMGLFAAAGLAAVVIRRRRTA